MNNVHGVITSPQNLSGVLRDDEMKVVVALTGLAIPKVPTYIHHRQVPAKEWVIEHDLGKYPSVTIVDSSGNYVIGEVKYISDSLLRVMFSAAFAGKAYLN